MRELHPGYDIVLFQESEKKQELISRLKTVLVTMLG